MTIELPPLPYATDALEPHISKRTLELHHGAHHKKYVDTVNTLIEGTPNADKSLEELVRETAGKARSRKLFNNAAQAWNHAFFWQCMTPDRKGGPHGALDDQIVNAFGSYEGFSDAFVKAAAAQFGSGWAWLIWNEGKLEVITTSNAEIPLSGVVVPLLTCDVWEHAYYLDYQNKRETFVKTFIDHLANWQFASKQLDRILSKSNKTAEVSELSLAL